MISGLFLSPPMIKPLQAGCVKQAGLDSNIEHTSETSRVDRNKIDEDKIDAEKININKIESSTKKKLEAERAAVVKTAPKKAVKVMQKKLAQTPEINLEQLVGRLKETKAIGFLTKLAIRSDVFDFRDTVESYRKKKAFEANAEMLKGRFDGLLLKIMTLLERDPDLSKDIHLARDSIWKSFVEVQS